MASHTPAVGPDDTSASTQMVRGHTLPQILNREPGTSSVEAAVKDIEYLLQSFIASNRMSGCDYSPNGFKIAG